MCSSMVAMIHRNILAFSLNAQDPKVAVSDLKRKCNVSTDRKLADIDIVAQGKVKSCRRPIPLWDRFT